MKIIGLISLVVFSISLGFMISEFLWRKRALRALINFYRILGQNFDPRTGDEALNAIRTEGYLEGAEDLASAMGIEVTNQHQVP